MVAKVLIDSGLLRLHCTTVRIEHPGRLTDFLGPRDQAFIHGNSGFVAIGEVARFETDCVEDADEWWAGQAAQIDQESEIPGTFGTGALAIGSFLFDPKNSSHRSVMIVPEYIIGQRDGKAWLTQIGHNRTTPTLPPRTERPAAPADLRFANDDAADRVWRDMVADVVNRIKAGEVDKTVIARQVDATATAPIDPRWVLENLIREYGSCWNYLVDGLVGASPEMIVRRENNFTQSRVLAGTVQQAEGLSETRGATQLLASSKNRLEHEMAVESVVEALKPYTIALQASEAPYVLTLPNVLHLATNVTGISAPEYSTLALADAIHPTGAVCGKPRDAARAMIAEVEGIDRARYAAPVGWIDTQGDGEWALAIRCGMIDPEDDHKMRLFAGAGILADSDPYSEWVETEAKLAPVKDALRGRFA